MSEWLGKIDVTTTLEDVINRPSSFNPYPEHADEGIEVWGISNPTFNPLYTVRYPKIDAGCRVVLPISHEVDADYEELPELLEGSAINGGFQGAEAANLENWIPIDVFWNGLSDRMSSSFLIHEGNEKGALDRISQLIFANASGSSEDKYTSPAPRAFIRQAIAAAQQEIQEGRPESGYAITSEMFRGFTGEHGGRRISNVSTLDWISDGLPYLLFPNFSDAWRSKLDPNRVTTVAHPTEIGYGSTRVVTSHISELVLKAWLEADHTDYPEAVTEKVANLQKKIALDAVVSIAELRVKLDEATRQFPEARVDEQGYSNWDIPSTLDEYILGVIASSD